MRRSGTWIAVVGIMFIMAVLLVGCKSRPANGASSPIDLLGILRKLPDSLRVNPFGDKHGLKLSAREMEKLISQKELELSQGEKWHLQFEDSAQTHLTLTRAETEEGLRYELLSLRGSDARVWVLVLQALEDHCCSYSRWALYLVQKGKLFDQTQLRMPQLDWADFFAPTQLAGAHPASPQGNRYPFSMRLQAQPAQIQISVVADYLEQSFPEEQVSSMLAEIPAPRTLVWEEQHFTWIKD
jgi:hypothetical protein